MDYKQYQHEMERLENAVDKISRDRDAWKARAEKLAEAIQSARRALLRGRKDNPCTPQQQRGGENGDL